MSLPPIRPVTLPTVLKGQTNGRLPVALLAGTEDPLGPEVYLVGPAHRAYEAMAAAADAARNPLHCTGIWDSYRPYDIQVRLFQQRYTLEPQFGQPTAVWQGKKWWLKPGMAQAAVPGTSNHGLGLAVDIILNGDQVFRWLCSQAGRYGFSPELTSEPWHWRYYPGDTIPQAVLDYEGDKMYEQYDRDRVTATFEAAARIEAKVTELLTQFAAAVLADKLAERLIAHGITLAVDHAVLVEACKQALREGTGLPQVVSP